ncbi:hypothetical protein [Nubsella zeaxanthinifaciens]|uniref:hypothetical protein n=1 Tax=Nubsella zeaxanthinifaciens TaxID=392412 RepID=UPI0018E575FC|nr:hypothetical protein [Nubsella zeaxanthinifaciens]
MFNRNIQRQLSTYLTDRAQGMIINKTLRFVDGNFRAQGWQDSSFKKWRGIERKGTILVKTGALRRSWNYQYATGGGVRFYNNVPYAKAHNEGFTGTVQVKAHTRNKYGKSQVFSLTDFNRNGTRKVRTVTNKVGSNQVKAHTRRVHIVQRQFAPYAGHESQTLNNSIIRELNREINIILRQ